ncbi:MAG: 4-hydroxy-3-methylbut-2-enyl diphosphate reductase [Erysipelotrichaceae bacterium]|nr:4-hydroxy-3-methylbut-2-enyl diphosphate reductase [Erysipelotrichaceae bacterium]
MEIIPVVPRGYCKGVVRAIEIAKNCAKDYPNQKITVLGMIVHNQHVVDALKQLNIHTIENKKKTRMELLDEINEGVVIFTAHGISEQVKQKAREKGLICVDASCTDVIETQKLVQEKIKAGYTVLYIGKKNHPEAEAVLSISNHVHLITCKEDLNSFSASKLFVTNQTTMSLLEIETLIEAIVDKWPQAEIAREICNATSIRQKAVLQLKDKQIDLLIVVGDPSSNNSTKLKVLGTQSGIQHVLMIETVHDLSEDQIASHKKIAVTSGASTPTILTNQVIETLNHYAQTKEWILPDKSFQIL